MSVLKVKENGVWKQIETIKGDTGPGVATGGTTGQVLRKKSNTNYDTEWVDGGSGLVDDVKVNGTSVVTNKVANIDLSNYSLVTETGNKIDLSIDSSTYIMTLLLKDKNNNTLSTGTIDLPLETMVVGATYDNVNKKIVLTLKNGQTIDVPVGDLVNGLASQSALDTEITNRQNADNLKENIFRYTTMPTATASNVGNIIEYIGTTDSNYTKGYFYENVNVEVQESITATQTDSVVPLGTITLNNNTLKSQLNAGTYEFVYRPYDTVLNFMNLTAFPPVSYQVTRESTFDRQPMIPNAPKMYSWVDNSNNFYITDTLQPNALTKLYLLDIQTNDATDTGATFISSNTPSQIEGRWTKKTGDVYEDVELSDYGILLSSSGLPGNTIQVVYTPYSNTYNWTQKNVQPSGQSGTTWGEITGTLSSQADLQTALNGKVNTEQGKGLSTNDYTTAEKTKLAGLSNYDDTEVRGLIGLKQSITDNTLVTTNKTVPGAISELSTRISNLQNIGRFLAIWDCSTGLPTSEPSTLPYQYKTGDYYRVGDMAMINYVPEGSSYNGTASTSEYIGTVPLSVGAVFYYDGTVWRLQASAGGGTVQDVIIAGSSALSGGIVSIPVASSSNAGVVKVDNSYGLQTDSGMLKGYTRTFAQYGTDDNTVIIDKGTLENIITGRNYKSIIVLTQAEYDALTEYADNTEYHIIES